MRLGVTVGKFNPPHLGHLLLLIHAAERCDELHVLVGTRPGQALAPAARAAWLVEAMPDRLGERVTVHLTPEDIPEAPEPWAARALELLPRRPDVAFTSEDYGPPWAAAMGCAHVAVDVGRTTVPTSGSALRADLRAGFGLLVAPARAALARRVALVGAESTGKSTLAEALAARIGTTWVPEHGRVYWEGRRHLADQGWDTEEFRHIARTQHAMADALARRASAAALILDTDALVTAVWHRRYLGVDDPVLDALADRHRPHLYLVCAPDIPWLQDGTRESAEQRRVMHEHTLDRVNASAVPWLLLVGSHEERITAATAAVNDLTAIPPLR